MFLSHLFKTRTPFKSPHTNLRRYSTLEIPNQYCRNSVSTLDYPFYFTSMFLPPHQRDAVLAVRAFNIELAGIKDLASRPDIGRSRIMWWIDQMDDIYSEVRLASPVSLALREAVLNFRLTKEYFLRSLYARIKDLYVIQPKTVADVEDYVENTAASLLYLNLEILDIKDKEANHAALHLGKAIGIVTLLRALPFHLKKGSFYLPQELTIKHGVSQEQLLRGEINDKVKETIYELANMARGHLDHARELKPKLTKGAHLALLPAAFYDDFLTKLQKVDFNPMERHLLVYGFKPRFQAYKNYYLSSY